MSATLRRFAVLLIAAFTGTAPPHGALAQAERHGVLLPSDQQRQKAILAAPSGEDEPLPVPLDEATVDSVPDEEAQAVLGEPMTESELERKVAESLEPVSLDEQIQYQVVQPKLEQFGYDIFDQTPSTFAPVESIPVPPDYMIGPGDTFTLQIFGPADLEYRLVVTREGRLLVPEVGDIQVAGMTFEEAKLVIGEAIAKLRIGVKSVVTLAALHTIQVLLVGDVESPGSYTVSGLSNLLNTLITTGGIKRTGSLRDIQVRRAGKIIARMDLYQVLLRGHADENIYLRHGDVIFVPPIGVTVGIAGEVHRPAIYELKDETTVDDLLSLSGGLLPTASLHKPQIERLTDRGTYTLISVDLSADGREMMVVNGDLLRVYPVMNKLDNVVLLSGNVLQPGGFEWMPGMRVSDLIQSTEQLRQGTDFDIALIQRERRVEKRIEVIYFDLGAALADPTSAANRLLAPRDQVVVFDLNTPRAAQLKFLTRKLRAQATPSAPAALVELKGYHRHAGVYPLQRGNRLLDVLQYGGGIQMGTDVDYSLLVRVDPLTAHIDVIELALDKALQDPSGDHNPEVRPRDRIYVFDQQSDRAELIKPEIERLRQQTGFGNRSPVVEVSGKVRHPGTYPLTPGMRVNDLIVAGGGMLEDAFGMAATLSRRVLIDSEYSRTDDIDISLDRQHAMLADSRTLLKAYDHLILRIKPEWIDNSRLVTITGEVRYPGTYEVDRRATLCGLIQRVGGFTEDAYPFGMVFLRDSIRKREQEALDRIMRQFDDLLAQVHTSPGFEKDSKLPVNQTTRDTYEVIARLKPEKALGRMVVDVEAAIRRCDEEPDIVLEAGDRIIVPKYLDEVSVVGQVYFPTSHQYRPERGALDYIDLSGGPKQLAISEHAYIVQANGEVHSVRREWAGWNLFGAKQNVRVTPGALIFVPLDVDRINDRELTQSWVDLFYKLALSAASVNFLFGGQ